MRILYLRDYLTVHDHRFLRAIQSQGHVPVVVCLEADSRGNPCRSGDLLGMHASVEQIAAIAADKSVDLVHAGPVHTVACAAASSIPPELPLVVVSWGRDVLHDCDDNSRYLDQALVAIDRASVVLADCEAVKRRILEWRPGIGVPFVLFPWGVDLKRFDADALATGMEKRRVLGWTTRPVFISTRSWEPIYGVDLLVAAFADLLPRHSDARLILIGDGSQRERIIGEIDRRGVAGSIHLAGAVREQDLPAWYAAADVYVSSSRCDGSSVSLLEAMATGMPALVHFEHGNPEWITDGVNGWLVDCRSRADLLRGMQRALGDASSWAPMGVINRDIVGARADWSKNAVKLTEAYRLARVASGGSGNAHEC